ncbi:MAG TPA: NAD(P)-dependent oxidoreductase, partial [Candidatus Hydrogenedentes bacterium]|nr:NAD(P)-dependent oxidoreductase [Candidatus Hydrogenedentota bacterium]
MRVGIIGLGLVGSAVSKRLGAAGHCVCGYDIAKPAREQAVRDGVHVKPDAAAVAAAASTLFLCLMDSADRRALLWGEQALAAALQPRAVLLDISTARPEDIVEDGKRLAEQGVRLVDVCLSGSSEVIGKGQALALVGDSKANAPYRGLLETFTKAQYFFDRPGEGNRMKLIVNMAFGLNRLALAETLGVAAKAGFDLHTVLDILKSGETYSACMDTKGPKMIAGVYEPPAARLAQHAKDVGLVLELAQSVGARVPISETHLRLLGEVMASGDGDLD